MLQNYPWLCSAQVLLAWLEGILAREEPLSQQLRLQRELARGLCQKSCGPPNSDGHAVFGGDNSGKTDFTVPLNISGLV